MKPYDKTLLEKGLSYCPNNKIYPFNLFLDLHKLGRKLTLKRYFAIQAKKKNNSIPKGAFEANNEQTRPGKVLDIKGTSRFYPVESQGHHLWTFLDTIEKEFWKIVRIKISQKPWQKLSQGEQKALRYLSENKDKVIRAADKGGGVVIQDFEDYNQEAFSILADEKD